MLRAGNHTLERALTDPRVFDGIGSAYSDEILHAAKLVGPLEIYRERANGTLDLERESLHICDGSGRICGVETWPGADHLELPLRRSLGGRSSQPRSATLPTGRFGNGNLASLPQFFASFKKGSVRQGADTYPCKDIITCFKTDDEPSD
ncbi:hypothetical protein DB30_07143 [Enhygromyxa salina]|uniref:Uncharacterized protein n=1 Tax=Enhygromyxa salina TaxID=215803 RepID=A0A0C2DGL3_9BACT|nr:hypothetical protein [Enhygromyxa salina]KIG18807.1 hypothetical protein DB30_07143 [Enhygromyxa salina]